MNETPPPPPEGSVPPPPQPPGGPGDPPPQPPADESPRPFVPGPYPVDLAVEFQDRELNRKTTFFRFFTIIPIAIVLALLTGGTYYAASDNVIVLGGAGLIALPTALMIIFRRKYPRWWFDFNRELAAFMIRVAVYFLLIDDRYPSTTDGQAVALKLNYPDAERELSQFMPIIKWLLAIPHFVVLFFLWIGVFFGTIYAWFTILFTGRYPKDVFDFVVGVMRWNLRVAGYCTLFVTDEYPPFRLES